MSLIAGVLALQGDFAEHIRILESLKVNSIEVRNKIDLEKCSCLIIPGGESTSIARLLETTGLGKEIKARAKKGMALYGTCAGAILCAKKVIGEKRFTPLGIIDIDVKRNAYGRQVDSFETKIEVKGLGELNGVFIRAPVITRAGKKVEVLASLDKKPVLARQGKVLVGTFHPETEGKTAIHELFLEIARE